MCRPLQGMGGRLQTARGGGLIRLAAGRRVACFAAPNGWLRKSAKRRDFRLFLPKRGGGAFANAPPLDFFREKIYDDRVLKRQGFRPKRAQAGRMTEETPMKNFLSEKAKNIAPYAAGEQPKDKKYVKLNTNENPYPPSPKALEAYKNFDFSSLNLYPAPDADALRAAVAEAEGVLPENVFCGNGSDEILALCLPAFFDEGGEGAAFADITYSFYPVFCNFFGVKYTLLPLEADFSLDLDKLSAMPAQGLIVANPNAPTGIGIPLAEIERFVRENSGRVVIIDEAYMPFFNESAVPLIKKYKNLLVVKTFSKGYSLAGMRCGYAVGDVSLIEGLFRCKDCFNSYPLDRVCQAVCAAAISDGAYYAEKNALVISERERLTEALRGRGFEVLPSKSNFVFARHERLAGKEVYEGLRARGVLVRHFQKPRIENFCRITIGSRAQNDALLKALDEML